MYIYDALVKVAPLFNPLTKKGTKIETYPDRPYFLTKEEKEERERQSERENYRNMIKNMTDNARKINESMKGEAVKNGSDSQ